MPTIPYSDYGVAGVQNDSFTQVEILAGDTPAIVTDYGIAGSTLAAAGIPAWTPVIVNPGTRAITLPVQGTSKANALTTHSLEAGSAATSSVQVYKAGMFNIDAINWAASFDTVAERQDGFDMAACQIYVKKPYNNA